MTNRSTILAKIKALLAKTPEAGCTEGEALAAAAKASELLMQYGFSENDLEEREEITCETIFAEGKRLGCLGPIAVFVADFADVRVWGTKENGQSVLKFFGKESDVQVAKYLLHLLHTATRLSWEAYFSDLRAHQDKRAHGRTLRADFEAGMRHRLRERLVEIKAARLKTVDPTTKRTGQDIVLVKNAEVDAAFKALSLRLRGCGTRGRYVSDAVIAGKRAADSVNITTGVGGGTSSVRALLAA